VYTPNQRTGFLGYIIVIVEYPFQGKLLVRPLQRTTEGGSGFPTSSLLLAWDPTWKEVRRGARQFYHDFFGVFDVLEGIEITPPS
jgi:hypothetical protein